MAKKKPTPKSAFEKGLTIVVNEDAPKKEHPIKDAMSAFEDKAKACLEFAKMTVGNGLNPKTALEGLRDCINDEIEETPMVAYIRNRMKLGEDFNTAFLEMTNLA